MPGTLAELVTLPGIGRKTANVVLGHAFGVPGITVDTHMARLTSRFGLTDADRSGQDRTRPERPAPQGAVDRVLRPGDLPRTAGVSRQGAACGACFLAPLCPSYGVGTTDPEAAAALVVGPEREHLLSMVGLAPQVGAAGSGAGPSERACERINVTDHRLDAAERGRPMSPDEVADAAAVLGHRLVGDDQLPPWMRPLVGNVHEAQMPGQLRNLVGLAPANARRGAVLMLFGDGPGGPDLLLTERSATMRSHAGQPAFPGGASDPGEDAITAALREGQEETGLVPASVLPVALLPDLYLPPSGFLVRPVLGYWREPGEVGPSTRPRPPPSPGCRSPSSSTRRTGAWSAIRAGSSVPRSRSPTCWSGASLRGWSTPCWSWAAGRCLGSEPHLRTPGADHDRPWSG